MGGDEPNSVTLFEDFSFDPTVSLHELKQLKENRAFQAYLKSLDELIKGRESEAAGCVVDQAIATSDLIRVVSLAAGGAQSFEVAKRIVDTRIAILEHTAKLNSEGEQHGTGK